MTGIPLDKIRAPVPEFDPGKSPTSADGKSKFETEESATLEDKQRARRLERVAERDEYDVDAAHALDLAKRLEGAAIPSNFGRTIGKSAAPPKTLASSRYYRDLRRRIIGNLCEVIDGSNMTIAVVTLLPKDLEIECDNLDSVVAPKLMERLRAALIRAGATDATGFIFAGLHGEFDSIFKIWRLHFHLIAGGEMIQVVERLKGQRNYPDRQSGVKGTRRPSVRISRKPITDLPRAISYVIQSSWPDRPTGDFAGDGKIRRARRQRIPEPYHTLWLLWMDRWSIGDMVLMMGLRVTKSGFQLTKK